MPGAPYHPRLASAADVGSDADSNEAVTAKVRRALFAGPSVITKDATVAGMDVHGEMKILRRGTNQWICTPGNENKIGDPPMCADPIAMQWFADAKARKPKPTNTVPRDSIYALWRYTAKQPSLQQIGFRMNGLMAQRIPSLFHRAPQQTSMARLHWWTEMSSLPIL
jgi:hypothetical protein